MWAGVLVCVGFLILSCLTAFVSKTGPAVAVLCNGLLVALIFGFMVYRNKTGCTQFNEYVIVLVLAVPIVLSIVANTNSMPEVLNGPGLDDFRANYQR